MEFMLITTVKNGESTITHITPQYLTELSVASQEEYAKSICVTEFDDEHEQMYM